MISELFELLTPVNVILQDTYYKGEGQIELKYSVRNVAGENFTEEIDGQQLSIVELKVSSNVISCLPFLQTRLIKLMLKKIDCRCIKTL